MFSKILWFLLRIFTENIFFENKFVFNKIQVWISFVKLFKTLFFIMKKDKRRVIGQVYTREKLASHVHKTYRFSLRICFTWGWSLLLIDSFFPSIFIDACSGF